MEKPGKTRSQGFPYYCCMCEIWDLKFAHADNGKPPGFSFAWLLSNKSNRGLELKEPGKKPAPCRWGLAFFL
jgi:hypothetical protein